jgi:hypothetical protein
MARIMRIGIYLILLFPITAGAAWIDPVIIDATSDCANVHYTQGGGKLVRINNTTIALVCNGSNENIRRSTDNGATWTMIDNELGYSGCLISGPNNYVYHFSRYDYEIRMVKFLYNAETIPAPFVITSIGDTVFGAYRLVNATIDADGNLYVFYHHDDESISSDGLFVIKSEDAGATWRTPVKIADGSDGVFGAPDSEVRENGDIVVTFSEWGGNAVWFGISTDEGANWSTRQIADGIINPTILTKGSDIYIFGQASGIYDGPVFTRSTDGGSNWSSWVAIQSNATMGYGDPFPALGSDDTIYVAFRGAQEPTSLSDDLRQHIAMSTDAGASWTFPFYRSLTSDGRVGTKSHIRYQTFWNYGGPLEWTWLEEQTEDADDYPTLYNINTDVTILAHPGVSAVLNFSIEGTGSTSIGGGTGSTTIQ